MSFAVELKPEEVKPAIENYVLADHIDMVMDLEKSHDCYIYDSLHQRELLDLFSCFATIPLGYNHPKMNNDAAFLKNLMQAALINPSNSDILTTQMGSFIQTFGRVAVPSYLKHSFFIAGGALAIENALKVAMDWKVQKNIMKGYRATQEYGTSVLHFSQAFHGRSGYTVSLTNTQPDKTRYFAKFEHWPRVLNPKIVFPYTDENYEDLLRREAMSIQQIKSAFVEQKDAICAIIIEPIQCEGGDNHFRKEFMEQLRQLCDENECLLIFDEVQTGVGMTGKFWAHEHFGEAARPDLIAFGKKMQICGIIGGPKIDEVETNCFAVSSRINSTWGGNLVDMVRAEKILEIIEEDNLLDHVQRTGDHFMTLLQNLSHTYPHIISNVRGKGLLCAIDLPNTHLRDQLKHEAMKHGIMLLGAGSKTIRFRPSLTISSTDLEHAVQVLDRCINTMAATKH